MLSTINMSESDYLSHSGDNAHISTSRIPAKIDPDNDGYKIEDSSSDMSSDKNSDFLIEEQNPFDDIEENIKKSTHMNWVSVSEDGADTRIN